VCRMRAYIYCVCRMRAYIYCDFPNVHTYIVTFLRHVTLAQMGRGIEALEVFDRQF